MANNDVEVECTRLNDIFLTAEGFYNSYKYLRKQLEESIGKMRYDNILPVAATNGFFAVELYLKTILAQSYWDKKVGEDYSKKTKFPKGHDLKKLFECLDDELKEQIWNAFSNDIEQETFMEELGKCKDGFMEWRYYFEKGFSKDDLCLLKENFWFVSDFLEALRTFCSSYLKNYSDYVELEKKPYISVSVYQKKINQYEELEESREKNLKEVLDERNE